MRINIMIMIFIVLFFPLYIEAEIVWSEPQFSDEVVGTLKVGESDFRSDYSEPEACSSISGKIHAIRVDGKCLRTNISDSSQSIYLGKYSYVEIADMGWGNCDENLDPDCVDMRWDVEISYYLDLVSNLYANSDKKVLLPEIVIQVNDSSNDVTKSVIKNIENNIEKPVGASEVVLYAGSTSDALYFEVGWNNQTRIVKIDYNSTSNLLSFSSTDEDIVPLASIVTYGLRDWINSISPNYELAEEIMQDSNKNKYVDISSLDDFQVEHKLAGNEFTFKYSTTGEFNNLVVQQYQNNSTKAPTESIVPEEEESGGGTIPNPGSGEFLEIVTIVLLAVVGVFIVIKNKRTFTKL